jgi:hypothetical protein
VTRSLRHSTSSPSAMRLPRELARCPGISTDALPLLVSHGHAPSSSASASRRFVHLSGTAERFLIAVILCKDCSHTVAYACSSTNLAWAVP